jgi:hypothetical protein
MLDRSGKPHCKLLSHPKTFSASYDPIYCNRIVVVVCMYVWMYVVRQLKASAVHFSSRTDGQSPSRVSRSARAPDPPPPEIWIDPIQCTPLYCKV